MDAIQSLGLAQTYFAHYDYWVVLVWVHMTYLSPDTIKQKGPQTYHYVKFFVERVDYTFLGNPCDHICCNVFCSYYLCGLMNCSC